MIDGADEKAVARYRARTMLENHIQTIIMALVLAVMSWVGLTVQDTAVKTARLEVQVADLRDRVNGIGDLRLSSREADLRFRTLEARMDALEGRIDQLAK